MIITYSGCVFAALGIQHALRMCRIIWTDLRPSPNLRFEW